MHENIKTAGEMIGITALGVTVSVSDIEAALRIISLVLTISYTTVIFIKNNRKQRNENKQNK